MKTYVGALAALWACNVDAHATFQALWVNGADMISLTLAIPRLSVLG